MKILIPILLVAALVPGCKSPYDYMENWLIREDAVRPFSVPVDIIYVQDQLYDSMNALPEMQSIAMDAVGRGKFDGFARVFSPLVASEDDVEKAVEWYLKHHNSSGRPFAFIGEGEGGRFLKAYEEADADDLKENGLVASYYTDEYRKGFVTEEMVAEIKKAVMRARFKSVWGKDMPEDMLK